LLAAAGGSYLFIAVVLWWHAWSAGVSTHTLCGCGDPALFLWFFQWPATAVAHLHNPFYSTALFHPGGVNLLAQTSVLGLTIPLVPVTWIFGPVAAVNVAATLTPALSAFAAFVVLRRWVHWAPAAYLGGLLFGFSPFVLTSLEFAHFMTAAVMLLPLILAVLDEIIFRRRHDPRRAGLLLGLLVFWQFFLSSEVLAILALLVVLSVLALVAFALVFDRAGLLVAARPAATGLAVGLGVAVVLLAYPVWFALDGPAHLSGLIWPNIGGVGGFIGASFVGTPALRGTRFLSALGGYEGTPLPSAAYLGWGLLGVLAAGTLVWFRDRRLWFFGLLLGACVLFSLIEKPGEWVPARLFDRLPVLKNVIEQRFMLFGFLAAAVMLAVILDLAHSALPSTFRLEGAAARVAGAGAALGLAAVALAPMADTFAPVLPFTMAAVVLPRWYTTVAPRLPPGRVLLSYPAPFSGIQSSMAWQAVDVMAYGQAGGGGPQGVRARAGSAAPGFAVLTGLAFAVTAPQPAGTPAQLAAVRHAIAVWRVNTVVIAPLGTSSFLAQGHDPTYAAAFMTAVLGRLPRIEAGAWVWNGVTGAAPAVRTVPAPAQVAACVAADERHVAPSRATLRVARCVLGAG
jgi:dolichyl-phosphate beta-glucosyltransferase